MHAEPSIDGHVAGTGIRGGCIAASPAKDPAAKMTDPKSAAAPTKIEIARVDRKHVLIRFHGSAANLFIGEPGL
jgi:hypothetical protein